jgi:hypothetical protein
MKIGDKLIYKNNEYRTLDKDCLDRTIIYIDNTFVCFEEHFNNGKINIMTFMKTEINKVFTILNPKKEKFDEELKKL